MELLSKPTSQGSVVRNSPRTQQAPLDLSSLQQHYTSSACMTQQVDLASMIDHTILRPDATEQDVIRICQEAKQYNFCAVCVNSYYTPRVARELRGTNIKVAVVAGFPLGAMSTAAKAYETREAVEAGAHEIDMVINVGALKSGQHKVVLEDIQAVVQAASPAHVKVILETTLLTDEEKIAACVLSKMAGAHFVKTSTGFGGGGATYRDVQLMRKVVGEELGVKASGGVRTKADALCMVSAGANRIGASKSVAIVTGDIPKEFTVPLSCM